MDKINLEKLGMKDIPENPTAYWYDAVAVDKEIAQKVNEIIEFINSTTKQ
jgi:hypothetical protein